MANQLPIHQYDYEISKVISMHDYPFYALILAAMRQADTNNSELLQKAFPLVARELLVRYNAPGGLLEGERMITTSGESFCPRNRRESR